MAENNIESLAQRIRDKKSENPKITVEGFPHQKNGFEFNKKFLEVYELVVRNVEQINNAIAPENLKLEVISDVDNNFSSRKSVQIVLNEKNKDLNLLEDPYLLIEGYPNNNEIRIATGSSSNFGQIVDVNNVNSDILTNEISDFILKSV